MAFLTKLFVGAKILPQEGFRMWKDVYADFTDLPKHEQQKLFNLIKEEFFSDEEEEMNVEHSWSWTGELSRRSRCRR